MIAVEKSWGRYVTFPKIKNYELESKKIEHRQDENEEEDTAVCELMLLDLTSKKTRRSLNKRALKRESQKLNNFQNAGKVKCGSVQQQKV